MNAIGSREIVGEFKLADTKPCKRFIIIKTAIQSKEAGR
jgi:hypothetical protein